MDLLKTPPTADDKSVDLTVHARVAGTRLDQYLVATFPGHSRSAIQRAIEATAVTVNGQPTKASYRLRDGDRIRIWLPDPEAHAPVPEDIPLEILYEDDVLVVINKPPDMVVHPAKGNWSGTLVNALRFHFDHLSGLNGDYRPGIVHRLDRDTSGVILVAKEESAHRDLSMQFETRKVYKEYLAITSGVLDRDSDYIERAIGPHPHDREKKAAYLHPDEERNIKEACTYYEVIERFDGFTFVKCMPKTGRTHQIRVHLACVGCPILADKAYGGRSALHLSDLIPELAPDADEVLLSRQALHAHRLRFQHPRTGRWIEAQAHLPKDMERTLAALRRHRPPQETGKSRKK
ncbi:MAG: RluA family pseudouridine synthase [Gemmatales bacterium]|nr:RluA family pseudouridine synthase [Gemmatales bacterium]MDW8385522.1 RluA family pseudouridine synthase [Gemmatales bacterium]